MSASSSPASPPPNTKSSLSTATQFPVRTPCFPPLVFRSDFCPHVGFARTGSQPPSLLVTVSGIVTHGKGPNNPRSVEGQPRVFSQTFMLAPDPNAPPTKSGEVAKYYITADALRFVG